MFRIEQDIEDRKAFATRKDHHSSDRSLSTGTRRRTAKAALPAKRWPACFGPDGIDTRRHRHRSVSRNLRGQWRKAR